MCSSDLDGMRRLICKKICDCECRAGPGGCVCVRSLMYGFVFTFICSEPAVLCVCVCVVPSDSLDALVRGRINTADGHAISAVLLMFQTLLTGRTGVSVCAGDVWSRVVVLVHMSVLLSGCHSDRSRTTVPALSSLPPSLCVSQAKWRGESLAGERQAGERLSVFLLAH